MFKDTPRPAVRSISKSVETEDHSFGNCVFTGRTLPFFLLCVCVFLVQICPVLFFSGLGIKVRVEGACFMTQAL